MAPLIQTAVPETAEGDVKKGFELFEKRGIDMPVPLLLTTASPGYFSIMLKRNIYFSTHPTLSPALLAHIRYFISSRMAFGFCTGFNKSLILKMGMTEAQFSVMGDDPEQCLLEDREKHLLVFVLKGVADPEAVGSQDIALLHQDGWTDSDIVDALIQAVGMMDHNILMRILKFS